MAGNPIFIQMPGRYCLVIQNITTMRVSVLSHSGADLERRANLSIVSLKQ